MQIEDRVHSRVHKKCNLELTLAVVVASVAAVLLVGHAMFVRAPVDAEPPTRPAGFDTGAN